MSVADNHSEPFAGKERLSQLLGTRIPWYALLVIIPGCFYWRTLLPGVGFWGDSAKFQFLGEVLGTSHLPGYPLYLMLNYLFVNLVPVGSLAMRVNLLSAVFTFATLLFLFEILILLGIHRYAAFITSLSFGLTYTTWFYSIIAEVYSLNLFFVAAVVYFLLRWRATKADWSFYTACGLYALSFGNHQLMIALLPSFAYIVWVTDRKVLINPKKILIVIGFVLLGLSQYLYIAWRTNDPTTAFLEIDTQTWLEFIRHPGVKNAFHMSLAQVITQRIPMAIGLYWKNYSLLLPLAVWGVFLVRDRQVNIFLFSYLVINSLFVLQFEIREVDAFFSPSFLVVAIYIGFAINQTADLFSRSLSHAWVFVFIPAFLVGITYRDVDQSQHVQHAERVESILNSVQRDALIITDEYDYSTYFWYYLIGEGYGKNNVYAVPLVAGTNPDEIKRYLEGESSIYSSPQRLYIPQGLRVYVLWRVANLLEQDGLQILETDDRYIREVRLPGD